MKEQLSNQYDFGQASPTEVPGFVLFKNEASRLWYFHCNDEQGRPILFSQAYQSQDAAIKGQQSCRANLQRGGFKIIQEGDQYCGLIVARNYQEVARTSSSTQADVIKKWLEYLMNVALTKEYTAPKKVQGVDLELENLNNMEQQTDELPARCTFRLNYYTSQEHPTLNGTITQLPDGPSHRFTGIGISEIHTFLSKALGVQIYRKPLAFSPATSDSPVAPSTFPSLPSTMAIAPAPNIAEAAEIVRPPAKIASQQAKSTLDSEDSAPKLEIMESTVVALAAEKEESAAVSHFVFQLSNAPKALAGKPASVVEDITEKNPLDGLSGEEIQRILQTSPAVLYELMRKMEASAKPKANKPAPTPPKLRAAQEKRPLLMMLENPRKTETQKQEVAIAAPPKEAIKSGNSVFKFTRKNEENEPMPQKPTVVGGKTLKFLLKNPDIHTVATNMHQKTGIQKTNTTKVVAPTKLQFVVRQT